MISIIIPAYNLEQYIVQCLDSIQHQDYEDYEVIIVNDGSTDGTSTLIESYIKRNNLDNFHLYNIANGGVTAARKYGVKEAHGEWLTFVDGDDTLPTTALSIYSKNIADNINIIIGAHNTFSEQEPQISYINPKIKGCYSAFEYIDLFLEGKIEGAPWAKLFRTSIFCDHMFDLSREIKNKEDIIMNYRIATSQKGMVKIVSDPVYNYRWMRQGSALTSYIGKSNIDYEFKILQYIEDCFVSTNTYKLHERHFAYLYFDVLYSFRKKIKELAPVYNKDVLRMLNCINKFNPSYGSIWKRYIKLVIVNLMVRHHLLKKTYK